MARTSSFPPLRAACLQLCSGIDAAENLATVGRMIGEAAGQGAELIQLPEMVNLMQQDKAAARRALAKFSARAFREALGGLAAHHRVWLHVGSLIEDKGDYFLNRGYLIDDHGKVRGRYTKIHLFDVDLADGESYRESAHFRAGNEAVVVDSPWGGIGLAICFDLRFPQLFQALAGAGARILTLPAASTATAGRANWHSLIRARAIETGSLMIATSQAGRHADGRATHGHSLLLDSWGQVLAEGSGSAPECVIADLDPNQVDVSRAMIPTARLQCTFEVTRV